MIVTAVSWGRSQGSHRRPVSLPHRPQSSGPGSRTTGVQAGFPEVPLLDGLVGLGSLGAELASRNAEAPPQAGAKGIGGHSGALRRSGTRHEASLGLEPGGFSTTCPGRSRESESTRRASRSWAGRARSRNYRINSPILGAPSDTRGDLAPSRGRKPSTREPRSIARHSRVAAALREELGVATPLRNASVKIRRAC